MEDDEGMEDDIVIHFTPPESFPVEVEIESVEEGKIDINDILYSENMFEAADGEPEVIFEAMHIAYERWMGRKMRKKRGLIMRDYPCMMEILKRA